MPKPQIEDSATGPVHDERQQDDGQDRDDHPEEEDDDAGNGMPSHGSRSSSHGRQLPVTVAIIRGDEVASRLADRIRIIEVTDSRIASPARSWELLATGRMHNERAVYVGQG